MVKPLIVIYAFFPPETDPRNLRLVTPAHEVLDLNISWSVQHACALSLPVR